MRSPQRPGAKRASGAAEHCMRRAARDGQGGHASGESERREDARSEREVLRSKGDLAGKSRRTRWNGLNTWMAKGSRQTALVNG